VGWEGVLQPLRGGDFLFQKVGRFAREGSDTTLENTALGAM
jgi:hypothetical protein